MQIGPTAEPAVPYLVDLLNHRDEMTRKTAAEILSHIGPAAHSAIAALREAIKDESDLVQRWAVHALGEIGPMAQVALIDLEQIRSSSDDSRLRAMAQVAQRKMSR